MNKEQSVGTTRLEPSPAYMGFTFGVLRSTNRAISELKEGGVFQIYEIFIIITTREWYMFRCMNVLIYYEW